MITVAIEDMMAATIVSFCENAAELGCPRDKDVDMWFRELSDEDRYDVMSKLIDIEERDAERLKDDCICDGCGCYAHPNIPCEEARELRKELFESKKITMEKITLDLEEHVIEWLIKYARSKIVNDRQALIDYGVNIALKEIIEQHKETIDED